MIALARKYRPRRFADLLVQDHVANALRGAVMRGRVGHGYLLTGPRGVGKTTAARILAMALNCERRDPESPTGEPCGECSNCQRVWGGSANLDVVEIDAASNRGVDDARELRERAMYAASQEGHHKIYIVDEAHMLTREAWNALLKILEEPPPGVIFVFATTEPQKIANVAAPVLSRLQRFDFRRIGPGAIRDRLRAVLEAEGVEADEEALTLIARHADGGMRDALSSLDQCLSFGDGRVSADRVRDILGLVSEEVYADVLRLVAERDAAGVFPMVDHLLDAGADLVEFLGGLGEVLRALLVSQLGGDHVDLSDRMREALSTTGDRIPASDAVRMLNLLMETETAVRRSANPKLAVETLLLRWTLMDRTVDLERVLSGGGEVANTHPPPAPRVRAPRTTPTPAPTPPPPPVSGKKEASAPPSPPPATALAFTLPAIQAAWPDTVETGRGVGRFLAEALGACRVVEVAPPDITVEIGAENSVLVEVLEKGLTDVERYLASRVGQTVRIKLRSAEASPPPSPKRLSKEEMRSERLRDLRGLDPALDTAMDELDLEIVDESPPRP
jgi:DNA polymerase-3 subunit gamma/tau